MMSDSHDLPIEPVAESSVTISDVADSQVGEKLPEANYQVAQLETDTNDVEMEDVDTTANEQEPNTDTATEANDTTENTETLPKPSKKSSLDAEKPVKLPVARIKRIVKQDGDVAAISTPAVYSVAAATELFVKYFTQQAYMRASAEKRKRMTYKDFSNSVEQLDQLQFLSQLIPQPKKLSELVSKGLITRQELPKNQSTLQFSKVTNQLNSGTSSNSRAAQNNGSAVTDDEMMDGEQNDPSFGQGSMDGSNYPAINDIEGSNNFEGLESGSIHGSWGSNDEAQKNRPERRKSTLGSVLNQEDDGDINMGDSKKTSTVSLQNLLE